MSRFVFFSSLLALSTLSSAQAQQNRAITPPSTIQSIDEYNSLLPYWGTTWKPESTNINGYHPSFYTGFAMRSQYPERIHIRQARGNQTRVSVILDENTISDYLFDLVKRDEFYKKVFSSNKLLLVDKANALPQLQYYTNIIGSPLYGIRSLVEQNRSGKTLSPAALYAKSLVTLETLNPGRVFRINLDLGREFLNWKTNTLEKMSGDFSNERDLVIAVNQLLPGRINYTQKIDENIKSQLKDCAQLARSANNDAFVAAAYKLFLTLTGQKYKFQVLQNGALVPALSCNSANACTLRYPEFTAIYPTGSVMSSTRDDRGNSINNFASPGLWNFYKNGSASGPDRIGKDPYYGWQPKLYYDNVGNAFHNPGIKFSSVSTKIKEWLGSPLNHSYLWSVKRGAVSHGCSRFSGGHIWEFRHLLPVDAEKIHQTYVFINMPQDFDIYDVNGDGSPEVMGVEYLISYGLKDGNYDNREADGLDTVDPAQKLSFYKNLYGDKGVFTNDSKGIVFIKPTMSIHSVSDFAKRKVSTRLTLDQNIPLYEQTYEKDKIQFYKPLPSADVVRLFGRVRGCAPSSNKTSCGEAAFDNEAKALGY